jgi:hypothetical protein
MASVKAAIISANPACLPRTRFGAVIRNFRFVFNAQSYLARGYFIVVLAPDGIVFP